MINIPLDRLTYSNNFLSEKECEIIRDYVIKNESILMDFGEDTYRGIYTHNQKGSLTGRYVYYNCLNIDVLSSILRPKIKRLINLFDSDESLYIQCWINTIRYGENICEHEHISAGETHVYASGNIFISGDPNPGTTFHFPDKIKNFKNIPGVMQLFHPGIPHGVKTYLNNDVRISIAFDIGNAKMLDDGGVMVKVK